MIISSSFCYLFFHWRCFKVSFFRQCSVVVLRCSIPLFPSFWWCSVVPVVFRYSCVVSSFSRCSVFRCSIVPCFGVVPSFSGCSVFRYCSVVPRVFRVPSFRVPGFIVCPQTIRWHKGQNSAETRCRGFLALESRCRGFSALESPGRGFLVLESRCRGICASTASFSFSLNLLCHIINVDM